MAGPCVVARAIRPQSWICLLVSSMMCDISSCSVSVCWGGHGVWTLKTEINKSSEPSNVPLPTTGKGPMGLQQCSCSKCPVCWWGGGLAGDSGAPGVSCFRGQSNAFQMLWDTNALSLLKSDASVYLRMMCPFSVSPELTVVTPSHNTCMSQH